MKKLRAALLAVLILTLVLCAYVPIQQQILRHRAERLLADIRTLQLRKSTWADAQILMKRWGAWGGYEGSCTESECRYGIIIGDVSQKSMALRYMSRLLAKTRFLYTAMGGKSAIVRAKFTVVNGLVWEKEYGVLLSVPPQPGAESTNSYGYDLIAVARTVSHFHAPSAQFFADTETQLWSPSRCAGCSSIYFEFSPYADPEKVNRVMNVDLSCLAPRKSCTDLSQLMPTAWQEKNISIPEEQWKRVENCELSLPVRGRDSQRSLLVQLLAKPQRLDDGNFGLKLRLLRHLKNSDPWELNTEQQVSIDIRDVAGTPHNSVSDLKPGDQYILLFEDFWGKTVGPFRELKSVSVDRCGLIPATVENLAAIQAGIERDFASKPRPQPLPLP